MAVAVVVGVAQMVLMMLLIVVVVFGSAICTAGSMFVVKFVPPPGISHVLMTCAR